MLHVDEFRISEQIAKECISLHKLMYKNKKQMNGRLFDSILFFEIEDLTGDEHFYDKTEVIKRDVKKRLIKAGIRNTYVDYDHMEASDRFAIVIRLYF